MDARQQDYSQSGLSSPYPTFPDPASEDTSADQASAAQYPPPGPDPRASNLTPTSDYSLNPSSARSGSFPDYIQRSYQPGAQGQAPGGMAQQQNPSIAAATSPTYSHQQQYSPYTPHHDMQHYPGHPQTPMYASRPEWAGQYAQPGMHYGHPATSGPPAPAMVSPVQRPPTVSHFCASTGIGYAPRHLFQERESCFASFPEVCSLACTLELSLTTRIGRTSSLYCVLFRSHSWCATTQATASTI
jgi:hypothetical protein